MTGKFRASTAVLQNAWPRRIAAWLRMDPVYGGDAGMYASEVRMRTMERSCGSCCHQAEHRSGGAVLQRQSLPPKLHVPHQTTEIEGHREIAFERMAIRAFGCI